jgi:hypothetical protein
MTRALSSLKSLMRIFAPAIAVAACGIGGFPDPQTIVTVRVLASMADKPYAKPGDDVTLTVLAYDGRVTQPEQMQVYWLPFTCINPKDDLYYACFGSINRGAGGGGAGAEAGADGGGGGNALPPPGVDLTGILKDLHAIGPSYSITIPQDIITKHPPVPGAPAPYGLVIVFNVACAGHLQILPADPGNAAPQQVPVGCFDKQGNQLSAEDYVIGFTRVYVYDKEGFTNQNPEIDDVTFDGNSVDLAAGVTVSACTASQRSDCATHKIDVVVPASSWEVNMGDLGIDGQPRHEEIWADYYSTGGSFGSGARLLYDVTNGAISGTANDFTAPADVADGSIWIVVHDNRNGTQWKQVPMHVQ